MVIRCAHQLPGRDKLSTKTDIYTGLPSDDRVLVQVINDLPVIQAIHKYQAIYGGVCLIRKYGNSARVNEPCCPQLQNGRPHHGMNTMKPTIVINKLR
jgi:hypothetical protein